MLVGSPLPRLDAIPSISSVFAAHDQHAVSAIPQATPSGVAESAHDILRFSQESSVCPSRTGLRPLADIARAVLRGCAVSIVADWHEAAEHASGSIAADTNAATGASF